MTDKNEKNTDEELILEQETGTKPPGTQEVASTREDMTETLTDEQEAEKRGISVQQWKDLLHVAKVADEKKEWIDETFSFEAPGRIKVAEDLEIVGDEKLERLPDNLEVDGGLCLNMCTGLKKLPENLKVKSTLDIIACFKITKLPENLEVGESLRLAYCIGLTELPENLKVVETLYLNNMRLKKLTENLQVGEDLAISDCAELRGLPENLQINGSLYLNDCIKLKKLPSNLKVNENLILRGCTGLNGLPKNLEVGGVLHLSEDLNEQVKKDAERLKKEGKIKGEIFYPKDVLSAFKSGEDEKIPPTDKILTVLPKEYLERLIKEINETDK